MGSYKKTSFPLFSIWENIPFSDRLIWLLFAFNSLALFTLHEREDNQPAGREEPVPTTEDGSKTDGGGGGRREGDEYDDPKLPDPNRIVVDLPPIALIGILSLLSQVIWYFVNRTWGIRFAKVVVVLVLVIWTPLNFGRIFTALEVGILPYRNTAFVVRQWLEEKGRPLDYVDEIMDKLEELPLPEFVKSRVDIVREPVALARNAKDTAIEFWRWLGDDPVMTPLFRFVSEQTQVYLVKPEVQTGINWVVAQKQFDSPIVEQKVPVALRLTEGVNGSTNPWGLHGSWCYSCDNIKSWLGTDTWIPKDEYVLSPIDGIVDRIIIDGTEDVPGTSIWLSSSNTRFAIIGVNNEDAKLFKEGDKISTGQKLARPVSVHLHVVLEVRNQDGTWSDYPLALLLFQTETEFGWFEAHPGFQDKYVPTAEELANRSDFLIKEVKGK